MTDKRKVKVTFVGHDPTHVRLFGAFCSSLGRNRDVDIEYCGNVDATEGFSDEGADYVFLMDEARYPGGLGDYRSLLEGLDKSRVHLITQVPASPSYGEAWQKREGVGRCFALGPVNFEDRMVTYKDVIEETIFS